MSVEQRQALRIANCSGFFGDRLSAAREMIDGGPVDVLTGDWLAELTMGVLLKQRSRDPDSGYARTFLTQLEDVLADCLDRGIKIVSNAGGLNPEGCAREVEAIAARVGRDVRVAVVSGDDATKVVSSAFSNGWQAPHLETGEPFTSLPAEVEVASAYLGCWGIAEALAAGADIVVTGRVTDASIIAGPAAWHFGWGRHDWDALAGAIAAGHVIECGTQATGGNFSFFTDLSGMERPGFPIAEIYSDGSSVITKHPGTGGAVTAETVTAQLLYEIDGPRYRNPDVVTRLDTATLTPEGPDRVRLSGVTGEPAPDHVKVGLITTPGYRNQVTFVLTGDQIEEKADLAQRALWEAIPRGKDKFGDVATRLLRADRPDPQRPDDSVALLTVSVADSDRRSVAAFARAAVETGLSSYPGLHISAPPSPGSAYNVFWPTLLPADQFVQQVQIGDRRWDVRGTTPPSHHAPATELEPLPQPSTADHGPTIRVSLGTILGARSGDKGGNATLGVWARDDASFAWLSGWLTEEQWRHLLPQTEHLQLRRWWLPNLRALGVTIVGILGQGVAANLDLDSQAKGLGEFFRARHADIPIALSPEGVRARLTASISTPTSSDISRETT